MNDLIRWAQSHVQETRDWDRRDEVAVSERIAGIVDLFQGVAGQVQVLLWSNDVHILSIIHDFTNKWHILQAEEGDFSFEDGVSTAKCVLCLPVEGTLAEDGSYKAALVKMH